MRCVPILPVELGGEVPERSKGADCKSAGEAFGGSNPPLSIQRFHGASIINGWIVSGYPAVLDFLDHPVQAA